MHSAARSIRANGIDLTFDAFGEPGHPPVLLIMGLAAQMIAWDDAFCTELARRGRWVVRFDNRDIGLSTRFPAAGVPDIGQLMQALMRGEPVTVPYLLTDMAADAVGLLDALQLPAAHVVGASMGGAIAQTMAIEHPARVRTLTSIMATSGDPTLPPPTPAAMQALLTPTPPDYPGYLARYFATWKLLRAGDFPLDEARDEARAKAAFDRGLNPAGVARQLAAILASGSRRAALTAVRTPTLVIHGDADPLVPLAHGQDVAAAVPGARLEILPGMGHALPISMWPRIIDAIASHTQLH
jgi:pimeloyl-ACP methyl ester carboxylesterase